MCGTWASNGFVQTFLILICIDFVCIQHHRAMKKKKTSKSPVVKVPWLEFGFDTENGTGVHPNLSFIECIEHVPSSQKRLRNYRSEQPVSP